MRESLYILLPPLFIVAGYTEMRWRRIPNWLTLSALIIALWGALLVGGGQGLGQAALGLAVGAGVFLPFCLAGALGGGDLKLMAAVGAILGYPLVLWALYYTVLAGGGLAIIYLLWTGQLLAYLMRMCRWLAGKRETAGEGLAKRPTLPFGLAIAAGSVWAIVMDGLPGM
jgi:prepilin peptidase CpaA